MKMDDNGEPVDEEEILENRKIALKMAREAAARGDALAGMLSELERMASPFYLGVDGDLDNSDIDCDIF